MGTFKRLTLTDGNKIDVNTDLVVTMQRYSDYTSLTFNNGGGINVNETADEILLGKPLRYADGRS